jgi:hypothetical protein
MRFPEHIKNYCEPIIKSTELKYILLLLENKIVTFNDCIKILKNVDKE